MRKRVSVTLFFSFFAVFLLGGLFFGYAFVYNLGLLPSSPQGLLSDFLSEVVAAPISWVLPVGQEPSTGTPWTGKERLNILLLGIDERDANAGLPSRSDTMIVLTVDPVAKTAGMLSIPRDMVVPIPGVGEFKINTAHAYGEYAKKGDGPILTRKTIEYNFGIPIHYYARVSFRGFEKLINLIGGVDIFVPRPIQDDEYPIEQDEGLKRIYVPAGWQHMDGVTALEYARSRHSENDFGRARRQQTVVVAAKDRVLQPDMLLRVLDLRGVLMETLATDIPAGMIVPLMQLARSIDTDRISHAVIDSSLMTDVYGDGTIYLPRMSEIQKLITDMFGQPGDGAGQAGQRASVTVLNGTQKVGLATQVGSYLKDKGYVVLRVDDADRADYQETRIIDRTGRASAAANIAQMLQVPTGRVTKDSTRADEADLVVILGADAKLPQAQ